MRMLKTGVFGHNISHGSNHGEDKGVVHVDFKLYAWSGIVQMSDTGYRIQKKNCVVLKKVDSFYWHISCTSAGIL